MKPTPRSSDDGESTGVFAGFVIVFAILLLVSGCVSGRRQRDHVKLYRVVPGEERGDFARLVDWIAERDGQITLPIGGAIHWTETAYYRWYSNETFVITTCPPRFHETRSEIRWLCGRTKPNVRGVGTAMRRTGYKEEGANMYTFPDVQMRPQAAVKDGVFGARFGDKWGRMLRLEVWQDSDQEVAHKTNAYQSSDSQSKVPRLNADPTLRRFTFNRLRGVPGTHMYLYFTSDGMTGYISIRMPDSPGLSGLDFMKEDPPVLRQGSFVVDESLAAKGLRQRHPVTKSQGDDSVDHR